MTFAEKLVQLRKREGYTQEELADRLEVSRQAISRWEMGTAVPDSSNLLQISKLFKVSADYLLNDDYESDGDIPAVQENSRTLEKKYNGIIRIVVGSMFAGLGAIGMFIMGIIGSVGDYEVSRPAAGGGVMVMARGFKAYLISQNIEWLFVMCIIALVAGLLVIFVPMIKKKK